MSSVRRGVGVHPSDVRGEIAGRSRPGLRGRAQQVVRCMDSDVDRNLGLARRVKRDLERAVIFAEPMHRIAAMRLDGWDEVLIDAGSGAIVERP